MAVKASENRVGRISEASSGNQTTTANVQRPVYIGFATGFLINQLFTQRVMRQPVAVQG